MAGRVLVFYIDTNRDSMEEFYQYVAAMRFPEGTEEGITAAGVCFPLFLSHSSPTSCCRLPETSYWGLRLREGHPRLETR